MKRTIEMILMTLLIVLAAVFVGSTLMSCSSDDDEFSVESFDPMYQIKYYRQDPNMYKTQRRWYNDKPIELYPQKEPPYILMVKWDSDEGKKALDYIAGKKDGVVLERYDSESDYEKNMSIIVCNKYITCPYLYISSSYKESTNFLYENEYIRFDCVIFIKMKEGKSVDPIIRSYGNILKRYTGDKNYYGVERFDCTLKTSYEVLRLNDEIYNRDDVEWAEPNMYAPIHNLSREKTQRDNKKTTKHLDV